MDPHAIPSIWAQSAKSLMQFPSGLILVLAAESLRGRDSLENISESMRVRMLLVGHDDRTLRSEPSKSHQTRTRAGLPHHPLPYDTRAIFAVAGGDE